MGHYGEFGCAMGHCGKFGCALTATAADFVIHYGPVRRMRYLLRATARNEAVP
jgi:hypothetical protein